MPFPTLLSGLLATFKIYIRSVFNYGALLVYLNYSATTISRLQKIQNRGLALGCHSASAVDHFHDEATELPVKEHLHLLSAQFLARALQEHHPSREFVTQDRGPRPMKETLRSKCIEDLRPFLDERGKIPNGHFPLVKKALHTKVVTHTIDSLGANRVLNRRRPLFDKSETSRRVSSKDSTSNSQLRSGFCAGLSV